MAWPLPALLTWGLAWLCYAGLGLVGAPTWAAFGAACGIGVAGTVLGSTRWRRALIALGFPAMLVASGAAAVVPAWAWLVPLGALFVLYPARTWGDAPLFPTPADQLRGLADHAPLSPGTTALDAGCGLGDALLELRREYPRAVLHGLEWSWPLSLACRARCRFAHVRRGDIWRADWSSHALVYLFQRPETMPRAVEKATRDLRAGAWLVSLEFEATSLQPHHVLRDPAGRPVWIYRAPFAIRHAEPKSTIGDRTKARA